ncbi:MAG: MotA/TolQ/ExbB proton channel family protein [Verrucomicrobium sp.]|nr:MotA/TolQ/ExbB proton channel family protein [Verrucomicrobium sp.]
MIRSALLLFLLLLPPALAETPPPLPPLAAPAEAAPAPALPAVPAPAKDRTLLDLYRTGGFVMHPLAAASVAMVAIALYLQLSLSRRALLPPEEEAAFHAYLSQGQWAEAWRRAREGTSLLSKSLAAGLSRIAAGRPAMEAAAADVVYYEEGKLLTWVHYLNVIATLAPMLGLLGTVTGMIASFEQLKSGRSAPADLAGGIGEAMVATATGLLLAIPAMFLFFHYRNRLSTQAAEAGRRIGRLYDALEASSPGTPHA